MCFFRNHGAVRTPQRACWQWTALLVLSGISTLPRDTFGQDLSKKKVHTEATKVSTPQSDLEIDVLDMLASLPERRRRLHQRFAAVAVGEVISLEDKKLVGTHFECLTRVMDADRGWDHCSQFEPMGPHLYGTECIRVKDEYRIRNMNGLRGGEYRKWADNPHEGEPYEYRAGAFDPLDDVLGFTTHLSSNSEIEPMLHLEKMLQTGKLQQIEWSKEGPRGTWFQDFSKSDKREIRLRFDPKHDFLPSGIEYESLVHPPDEYFTFNTRCRYRRHTGHIVPVWFQIDDDMTYAIPSEESLSTYKIYWLIGDELPDEYFDSTDPLAWLLDRFDVPHAVQVGNLLIPADYAIPEDLGTYNGEQFDQ